MTLRGTTPVPNVFFDAQMVGLTASAIRVYLKIVRNTLGWRNQNGETKSRDWISHSQFGDVGVSNRSVTNAIEELLAQNLIRVTDYSGNDLANPKQRKLAKRIFYAPIVDNPEKTTSYKAKPPQNQTQNLLSTKENLQNKYYAASERIPDQARFRQIQEEQQRKQLQRDSWNY